MPLSRDKNGRVHVPGDRVTRTGVGCLGFVAKDERAADMLRDNPVELIWGRRWTGSEVVVSGDQGEVNTGPAPAPCADGGAEVPGLSIRPCIKSPSIRSSSG